MILKRVLMASMEDVVSKMGCEPAMYYHAMILESIKKKDKERAMELMRTHIRTNVGYYDE